MWVTGRAGCHSLSPTPLSESDKGAKCNGGAAAFDIPGDETNKDRSLFALSRGR